MQAQYPVLRTVLPVAAHTHACVWLVHGCWHIRWWRTHRHGESHRIRWETGQIPRYRGGPTTVYLAVAGIYTYIPVLCPWVPAWALSTPHTQYNGIWGYTIILVYLPHTPIGPIPGGRRCDRCRDARWLPRLLHHRWWRAVRCSCGMHIWAHMPLYTLVQGTGGARYALPRCTVLHTMCTAVRTVLPDGMCAMADPFHHAFAGSIALCMSCRTCTQFRTERWIRSGTGFGPVGTDPSPRYRVRRRAVAAVPPLPQS